MRLDNRDRGLWCQQLARLGADPDESLPFLGLVLRDEEDLRENVCNGRSQPMMARTTWG